MRRESISKSTFLKGVGAAAVVAASLGALTMTEYSTKMVKYNFVPGTYTGVAAGMESDVKVRITVVRFHSAVVA